MRTGLIAACLVMSTQLAFGQEPPGDERLTLSIPPAFELAHAAVTATGFVEEYGRVGETPETWTELITVQRFPGLALAPQVYAERVIERIASNCAGLRSVEPAPWPMSAYPAVSYTTICPHHPRTGLPSGGMALAVGGVDQMFVVQFHWMRDPSEADLRAARQMLETVVVCDTRRPDTPCPEPEG